VTVAVEGLDVVPVAAEELESVLDVGNEAELEPMLDTLELIVLNNTVVDAAGVFEVVVVGASVMDG
jgi:hypothetical protein